jgi:hypothetical protein
MDRDPRGVVPSRHLRLRGMRFDRFGGHYDVNDDAAPDGKAQG